MLWWPLQKTNHVEGCLEIFQNFLIYAQDHYEPHTKAQKQSKQPCGVCFIMKMTYCRNFCLKIVVKSSLSTWFLTKKCFFTFDFKMMNFAFPWPRNEIWKRLGVFLKLTNALDTKCGPILKKLEFASGTFIFNSIFLWQLESGYQDEDCSKNEGSGGKI